MLKVRILILLRMKDMFGVELEYERIPRGDWETKTNISYSTGNEADFTTGGKEPQYKKWATNKYLDPIPEEAYTGDNPILKDWKNLWSEEDFKQRLWRSLRVQTENCIICLH